NLRIYSNDTVVPYHYRRNSGQDMYFLGNEKKPIDFHLVFWSKFFDSSILNKILFFNDGMHLYSLIFSNSRTLCSVSRIIEISKKTISTENTIYGYFNRDTVGKGH
ncbi:hypothetical protein RND81_O151800, partial [Saponaria officinalis]